MLPDLQEIKKKRRLFGMTQTDLSRTCGISQSLIAKIETGKLIPAYDKAKKIFDMLESMHNESSLKAKDIMNKNVLYAGEDDRVTSLVKKMSKNGISQMPVIEKEANLGTVSERVILEAIKEGKDFSLLKAKDVMEEAVPSVNRESPLELISSLLEYSPAVLVKKKGKIEGIITKADLLKAAVKRR